MSQNPIRISALYRYPVKGLSPERLARVTLTPGDPMPHDRRYAIENGPSGFDPAAPVHLPKIVFLEKSNRQRPKGFFFPNAKRQKIVVLGESFFRCHGGILREWP